MTSLDNIENACGEAVDLKKTRLELAFKSYKKEIVRLVSPPYTGAPDECEKIKPSLDKAQAVFLAELLKNEKEAINFFAVNRLEMEWCFNHMLKQFKSPEVYNAVYSYYARNFPSWSKEKIEQIINQKCT